ncbi:MAG TPA: hypothetical protein EYP10_14330 [Armatimonadetes bacterium]|nr:hypothetical protein [Armatimonadota bacterium]
MKLRNFKCRYELRLATSVAFIFLLTVGSPIATQTQVDDDGEKSFKLALRFEPGATYKINASANAGGQLRFLIDDATKAQRRKWEGDLLLDISIDADENVRMVGAEGDALIEMRLNSLSIKGIALERKVNIIATPKRVLISIGNEMHLDTGALREEQRKRIHTLLFAPVMLTLRPNGKIVTITGLERLQLIIPRVDVQRALAKLPPLLPDKPMKIGDEWVREIKLPPFIFEQPVTLPIKFRLVQVAQDDTSKHKVATIEVSAKLEMQDKKVWIHPPQLSQPVQAHVEQGTFAIEGKVQFDMTAGILQCVNMRMDMEFNGYADVSRKVMKQMERRRVAPDEILRPRGEEAGDNKQAEGDAGAQPQEAPKADEGKEAEVETIRVRTDATLTAAFTVEWRLVRE